MSHRRPEGLLIGALWGAGALSGVIVAMIAAFLVVESMDILSRLGIPRFFTDGAWHPTEGRYDLSAMALGTLWASAGAVALATPLGVISALFCRHYAPPRLGAIYARMIEVLAGVPSVVYGLWGLTVLVPLIGRIRPPGASLLAGILILGLMILPTIALLCDAAVRAVPVELVRGAAALGLSRWSTVRGVVLPSARPGLLVGVLLGAGRAFGETMAVLMVCGNVVQAPSGLFAPMRTLTANIALEMGYALGDHRAALFVSGLLLLIMATALVAAADLTGRRRAHA